jgi:hypothetical protein
MHIQAVFARAVYLQRGDESPKGMLSVPLDSCIAKTQSYQKYVLQSGGTNL